MQMKIGVVVGVALITIGCRFAVNAVSSITPLVGHDKNKAEKKSHLLSSSTTTLPSPLETSGLLNAVTCEEGKVVQVTFDNGSTFAFHSIWLRDACRDDAHVVRAAGERLLTSTPVGPLSHVDPQALRATKLSITNNDDDDVPLLVVEWNDASHNAEFTVDFLKRFAPIVGKRIDEQQQQNDNDENNADDGWSRSGEDIPTWLEPFTGYPTARAPTLEEIEDWETPDGKQKEFTRFDYKDIMESNHVILDLIQRLLCEGVVLVDNVPPEPEGDKAQELHKFIDRALGGLQKDPTRLERNWKIVHKPGAASISYDPKKRLYQHTDSSIPPHGIPALILSMHYVKGYGTNLLTDGYAVARDLRRQDPQAFDLLTTYGYDGERDFATSRMDSTQEIAKGLIIRRKHPIFTTDPDGKLVRLTYNEVFRMPMTLPYEIFPEWFNAFSKFVAMVHSEKYERSIDMKANTIILINNWRVLHGRAAGRASPDRHLVGGTILRESIYSKAMQLARSLKKSKQNKN